MKIVSDVETLYLDMQLSGVAAAVVAAAAATPIAANIKQVNDVTIQGAGVSGDSMRPV